MNIFRLFESKKFMKICSKTHKIAPFKKKFSEKHAPEPPEQTLVCGDAHLESTLADS